MLGDAVLDMYAFLGGKYHLEATCQRYKWREMRKDYFQSPEVQRRIVDLGESIMADSETCVLFMLGGQGHEKQLQPPMSRGQLADRVLDAIKLKCKLELGSSKFDFEWLAPVHGTYDDNMIMLKDNEAARHRTRIRFGRSPALFTSEPNDENEHGYEALERDKVFEKIPAGQDAPQPWKPRTLLKKAMAVLFNDLPPETAA